MLEKGLSIYYTEDHVVKMGDKVRILSEASHGEIGHVQWVQFDFDDEFDIGPYVDVDIRGSTVSLRKPTLEYLGSWYKE
jgi:hypothetical protein